MANVWSRFNLGLAMKTHLGTRSGPHFRPRSGPGSEATFQILASAVLIKTQSVLKPSWRPSNREHQMLPSGNNACSNVFLLTL